MEIAGPRRRRKLNEVKRKVGGQKLLFHLTLESWWVEGKKYNGDMEHRRKDMKEKDEEGNGVEDDGEEQGGNVGYQMRFDGPRVWKLTWRKRR